MDRRQARRAQAQAAQQGIEHLLGGLLAILAPEALEEHRAFLVGEAGQVLQAPRVLVVGEQLGAVGHLVGAVARQVAQQAHERQVEGLAQRLAHRGQAAVVLLAEVAEGVCAAAGEEHLAGAGRVLALQRGVEHLREAGLRVDAQPVQRPAAEVVALVGGAIARDQLAGRLAGMALVQFGDHFQVGGQHPQLGGGAQLQLAAFVDVERLAGGVGLHPHAVAVGAALEQGEAVAHVGGQLGAEQALAEQSDLGGEGRIAQLAQVVADRLLQRLVEGGVDRQVEAVQVVKRHAELAHQAGADGVDALVAGHRRQRRVGGRVAEVQRLGQRRVAQRRLDQPGAGQHPQVAVGQRGEFGAPVGQIPGRPALGDGQRQYPAQRQPLLVEGDARAAGQGAVAGGEVGAEPHPQAVADAVHLAVGGSGGERHVVQVVVDDLPAQRQGLATLAVGADARREHLTQLLRGIRGAPLGRVTELLDLRGQGAAAGGVGVGVELLGQLGPGGLEEARPVHRRVEVRALGVEQVAVLDEQQAGHQQRRDVLEARIVALRVAEVEHRLATAVGDVQSGAGLFPVGRVQAVADVLQQRRREARLAGDGIALLVQAADELGQGDVAQALVEGALGRPDEGGAGAVLDAVAQLRGPVGQGLRLMLGGLCLTLGEHRDTGPGEQHQHGEAGPDMTDAPALPAQHLLVGRGGFGLRQGGRRLREGAHDPSFHPSVFIVFGQQLSRYRRPLHGAAALWGGPWGGSSRRAMCRRP